MKTLKVVWDPILLKTNIDNKNGQRWIEMRGKIWSQKIRTVPNHNTMKTRLQSRYGTKGSCKGSTKKISSNQLWMFKLYYIMFNFNRYKD